MDYSTDLQCQKMSLYTSNTLGEHKKSYNGFITVRGEVDQKTTTEKDATTSRLRN